eukprot:m.111572 g.111572  ORF g.111572 m.111572 type:complete len:745 (+) comp28131_c0_seq3:301-2535(+)
MEVPTDIPVDNNETQSSSDSDKLNKAAPDTKDKGSDRGNNETTPENSTETHQQQGDTDKLVPSVPTNNDALFSDTKTKTEQQDPRQWISPENEESPTRPAQPPPRSKLKRSETSNVGAIKQRSVAVSPKIVRKALTRAHSSENLAAGVQMNQMKPPQTPESPAPMSSNPFPSGVRLIIPEHPRGRTTPTDPTETIQKVLQGKSRTTAFHGETLLAYLVLEPPTSVRAMKSTNWIAQYKESFQHLQLSVSVAAVNLPSNSKPPPSSTSPCSSISSLGGADVSSSPFTNHIVAATDNGELVYELHVQMEHVSAVTKHAEIHVSCILVSDPAETASDSWEQEVRQLCDIQTEGSASVQNATRGVGGPSLYFSNEVSVIVELLRPPYVFHGISTIGTVRYVSVEVQNHLDRNISVKDLQLCMSSDVIPTATSDTKGGGSRTGFDEQISKIKGHRRTNSNHSGGSSPDIGRRAQTPPVTRKEVLSTYKDQAPGHGTVEDDPATQIYIGSLNIMLPEVLQPKSRHSFMFVLNPPASVPTDALVDSYNNAVKVYALLTWMTPSLFLPISCQYELFSVQPRIIQLNVSISQQGPAIVGRDFLVTYTVTNVSSTAFKNLFITIKTPKLSDLQFPVKGGKSVKPSDLPKNIITHTNRRSSLLRQSLSTSTMSAVCRSHAQALDVLNATEPGLACLQTMVHLGPCAPNSKSTATVSFHAYKLGLFEIGLVQVTDDNDFVQHHCCGHQVYVRADTK